MTDRQRLVLNYIIAERADGRGVPDGPRIARFLGLESATSGYQYLDALEKAGYLEQVRHGRGRPTTIRLTDLGDRLLAEERRARAARTIGGLFPNARRGDYLLRVSGSSMTGAGIEPGALALIRPGTQARPGDICAVWVEGEGGTLKRVFPQGEQVRLESENPDFPELCVPAASLRIQGVLIASCSVKSLPVEP